MPLLTKNGMEWHSLSAAQILILYLPSKIGSKLTILLGLQEIGKLNESPPSG